MSSLYRAIALALLLAVPGMVWAQAGPEITEIKVSVESLGEGNPTVTTAYVRNHIRLRAGDRYQPSSTNADILTLMKTGKFHDVRVELTPLPNQQVSLQFIAVSYPRVTSVDLLLRRLDGSELTARSLQIKEKKLRAKLQLAKGRMYSDTLRQADERALREHYEDQGFYPVSVASEVTRVDGKMTGAVRYIITEGEKFKIETLRFEGNEHFDDDDLLDEVKARERRRWYNPVSWFVNDGRIRPLELEADIERLEIFYRNRGYLDAKVEVVHGASATMAGEDYRQRVNARNQARSRLEALELEYSDEEKKDPQDEDRLEVLEDLIDDQEDVVDDAEDALEDFLDDAAYVTLTFKVNEGPLYKVGKVDFEYYWLDHQNGRRDRQDQLPSGQPDASFKPVIPETILRSLIGSREGEVYAPERLLSRGSQSDLRAIRNYYGRKSHIHARVMSVRREPVLGTHQINLVFEIYEGNPFDLELVQIEGNEKTKDFVIRRELAIAPGERFDLGRVERSRRRIEGMRIFESVRAFPRGGPGSLQGAAPGEKLRDDLVVAVREKSTGSFVFGGGFSSDTGAFGQVILGQDNFDIQRWRRPHLLQGAGQKIRLKTVAGSKYDNYRLDFEEPWLMGRKLKFTTAMYVEEMSYYSTKFDVDQTGVTFGLERTLMGNDFLRGKVYYTLEDVGITDLDSDTSTELKNEAGHDLVSLLGGRLTYDTRGGGFLPNSGQISSLDLHIAPSVMGSDKPFFGFHARSAWYFKGLREGHVLELRGQTAVVESFNGSDNVPYLYRHHLGGSRSLRGFDYNEVGPRGDQNDYLRGETMAHATMEYSMPTGWDFLRLATFYDIGAVNKGAFDYDLGKYNDNWGVGLRLQVPFLGPLSIDYAFPISTDGYNDSSGNINVNFGYNTRF